jgi:hypothetical protein
MPAVLSPATAVAPYTARAEEKREMTILLMPMHTPIALTLELDFITRSFGAPVANGWVHRPDNRMTPTPN